MRKITINSLMGICLWAGLPPLSVFAQSPAHPGRPSATLIDTAAVPSVFAQGIVSSPYTEWATSFTPDGHTVYFSRGAAYWTVVSSTNVKGHWNKPRVASFSGKFNDTDPFVTPDGNQLFFISNRPMPDEPQDKGRPYYHIWYADRTSNGDWGQPHRLDTLINIPGLSNYAPSVSRNGTLFFCSRDREGHKGMQSYYARFTGGRYEHPVLLAIDSLPETQDPFIAPDEH